MHTVTKSESFVSKAIRELTCLSEAQLQADIVEPLLRSLGFENVRDNSGREEKGKDLVATKTSELGRSKLYAIQIKKTKLSGSVGTNKSLGSLFLQLRQAQNEEVIDPVTNVKRSPDGCVFITPYPVSPATWEKFLSESKDLNRHNIEFIDGSRLLDLVRSHLPGFLEHFSMEVRYRYQLDRDLSRIPESTLAFGLGTELLIEHIYIDISMDSGDKLLDRLATYPIWLQGSKLLIAKHAELSRLEELSSWWGAKAEIIDPPIATNEQDERNISELRQQIRRKGKEKVIQLSLDPLLVTIQRKCRDSLINLADINSNLSDEECTRIAKNFVELKENLRDFRDLPLVFDYWIYLVRESYEQGWSKPSIGFLPHLLGKIDCNKYVLGGPGAGKTTLLRVLAQDLARKSDRVLPIFLPLLMVKQHTEVGLTLACVQQLENEGYRLGHEKSTDNTFESLAQKGAIHLFLDGLDEVGTKARKLMDAIEKIAARYPRCRITLSCRSTFDIEPFRGALELKLVPFTDKQLQLFVAKWFTAQPSSYSSIQKWLKKNIEMRRAARIPLIAALLCSLYRVGAQMPSTEVELYERRFELLLGRWEHAKGIRHQNADLIKRYWKFITEMGFRMHFNERRSMNMSSAIELAEAYFSKKYHHEPVQMVVDCLERGILEYDRSGGISFGHLTYQEYLTARKLSSENDIAFIFEKITRSWWLNTLRFYAAIKEDISALLRFAINNDCSGKTASTILELLSFAPWSDRIEVEELRKIADFKTESSFNSVAWGGPERRT
jgi:hypothetical protein